MEPEERIVAKNEKASILLDADGDIKIEAKKILINHSERTI